MTVPLSMLFYVTSILVIVFAGRLCECDLYVSFIVKRREAVQTMTRDYMNLDIIKKMDISTAPSPMSPRCLQFF